MTLASIAITMLAVVVCASYALIWRLERLHRDERHSLTNRVQRPDIYQPEPIPATSTSGEPTDAQPDDWARIGTVNGR